MKLHRNAKLSVQGRKLLIERIEFAGWSLTQAAEATGVSDRTARKWLARYRAEGRDGCGIGARRRWWWRIVRTNAGSR
jgi:transposase